jgi:predicted molibdopterin-dependent oxidoreductase YjgC
MIRKDGTLVPVSYDEAVALVAEKFKKYSAESPASIAFLGSPRSTNEESYLFQKLARTAFKSNNISLDSESGHRNSLNVLNAGTGMPGMLGSVEEIRKTEFILVVGIDITKQNPIIGSEIHMAARAGARLVTMDSRRSQIAKLSKDFLQIKPGTKKIALLAIAKAMYAEGTYDKDFVAASTQGFDDFKRAFEMLPENEIADKTGIAYDTFKEIARALGKAKSAMVFFASGISGLDETTIGFIFNLYLMAGKVGKEACGVNPIAGLNNLQGGYDMGVAPDLLSGFQSISDGATAKKFASAWGADVPSAAGAPVYGMLSDPASKLKALMVVDHDEGIVRSADAIKKLEFVAYVGAYQNAFTEYATVVLPVATYMEDEGTFTNAERRIQLSAKKLEPAGGVLPGWKLYVKLAEKAGLAWKYNAPSDVMDEIAKLTPSYAGVSYKKLASGFGVQWPCDDKNPDGTKRFAIEKAGKKLSFVKVGDVYEASAAKADFPILLMVGKAQHFWHQNNLMKKTNIPMREYNALLLDYPQGYVEISADDAKTIQVRDRWPAKVASSFGEMKVTVRVSGDVQPGTAYAPYFVQDMISKFLLGHADVLKQGEDATIPVRIEKV